LSIKGVARLAAGRVTGFAGRAWEAGGELSPDLSKPAAGVASAGAGLVVGQINFMLSVDPGKPAPAGLRVSTG
jgi:hypothetical protein